MNSEEWRVKRVKSGDEELRVESGEWRVKSEEWRRESGKWRVESRECRMENREWRVWINYCIIFFYEFVFL